MVVIVPIIGVITIPHVQTAIKIANTLFKFEPVIVGLKLLNKEQTRIIAMQFANITSGVFIFSIDFEIIYSKILNILKFCIFSGFAESIPRSFKSFFMFCGMLFSIFY